MRTPLDWLFALSGLDFIPSRRRSSWLGREVQASLFVPLGEDTLWEPEANEGREQGVRGLVGDF